MMRTRILSTTAIASVLGVAVSAFAQTYAPPAAPAPTYTPAPTYAPAATYAPAPTYAPVAAAPASVAVPAQAAPEVPRTADDLTGTIGVGTGVAAGASLIIPNTSMLMMKYWISDKLAIVPRLALSLDKVKDQDVVWKIAPAGIAQYTLIKGASTRLEAGAGFGFAVGNKDQKNDAGVSDPILESGEAGKTYYDIFIPVQIGVEHFFTRWFAMGIATEANFLRFRKQGDSWEMNIDLNNLSYMGSLFFYTD